MSSAGGKGLAATTMHPTHIEAAARFAIGVANGRTLINQTIRGIQIDDTGTKGGMQMIVGGATNPAYTALQTTLSTELTPSSARRRERPGLCPRRRSFRRRACTEAQIGPRPTTNGGVADGPARVTSSASMLTRAKSARS
jgi:hypothetical protein